MNEIKINLDTRCKRCGKKGATQSGVCVPCFAKGVKNGEFDDIINKAKKKMGLPPVKKGRRG